MSDRPENRTASPAKGPVVLHIDSAITDRGSASRNLSAEVVRQLHRALPFAEYVRRDLELDELPHLNSRMLAAAAQPENRHDDFILAQLARNNAVLEEFLGADIIVIGAPMYNFAIPSQLKAWIDRIAIAGRTFRYTATGPEGLAGGKKVIIVSSRGGIYEPGTPHAAFDFQENYLRAVFAFIGIQDVEFVRAEGLALGAKHREDAVEAALASVPAIVRRVAAGSAAPGELLRLANAA